MTWTSAKFPYLDDNVNLRVVAGTTTRTNGVSKGTYDSFNLATHVEDDLQHVHTNRAFLRDHLSLPSEPYWLNQTHSNIVIEVPYEYRNYQNAETLTIIEADASYTKLANHVCCVMTADCLPLLMVNHSGSKVAAVHAGWRGLANGIIDNAVNAFKQTNSDIHVWLGPAIGANKFEVGAEVKAEFVAKNEAFEQCFKAVNKNKYMCDIYHIARIQLQQLGVVHISGAEHCTVTEKDTFFSYRRDGQTGRMASLIWFNN